MHETHGIHHDLIALFASIAVLSIAPLLYRASRCAPRAATVFDLAVGFATVVLIGLLVLPECVETHGSPALAAAAAGLLLPSIAERRVRTLAHGAAPWLTALALALHAATDGLAIAGVGDHHGHALGVAVVLHRLLEGLGLWWLLRPRGVAFATAGLVLVAVATAIGFAVANGVAPLVESSHSALFQAFACGLVLHVLLHRPVARTFDRVLPWAVAAFFVATAALQVGTHGLVGLPAALALTGLALVFLMPRMSAAPRSSRWHRPTRALSERGTTSPTCVRSDSC